MNVPPDREFKLGELAEESGVPARTIRLYIARGLLPGPLRAGRDAAYGLSHLQRLRTIRQLQQEGLSLIEIKRRLAEAAPSAKVPEPSPWWSYPLAPDVTMWVKADASPWRLRRIQAVLAQAQQMLSATEQEEQRT